MATTLPMNVSCGRLPLNYNEPWQKVFQAMVRRLRGTVRTVNASGVSGDSVLVGRDGVTTPSSNVGPWFVNLGSSSSTWKAYNIETGDYEPPVHQIGSGDHQITLAAPEGLDSSHVLVLQDATGTIALLEDVFIPRDTIVLNPPSAAPDATVDIDWGTTGSSDFFGLLRINVTYSFLNQADGMAITVTLQNLGTDYTVTWPAATKWLGGAAPTMPVTTDATATNGGAVGIFTFWRIGATVYGKMVDASPSNQPAEIDAGGNVPSNYGNIGNDPENVGNSKLY